MKGSSEWSGFTHQNKSVVPYCALRHSLIAFAPRLYSALVLSVEEWKALVLACMKSSDITKFSKRVVKMVGKVSSLDDLNRWIALAMNIWNATPQPDRGGKTPFEISLEYDNQSDD